MTFLWDKKKGRGCNPHFLRRWSWSTKIEWMAPGSLCVLWAVRLVVFWTPVIFMHARAAHLERGSCLQVTCHSAGQRLVAFLSEQCLVPLCHLSKQIILFCFSWLKTKVTVILNICFKNCPSAHWRSLFKSAGCWVTFSILLVSYPWLATWLSWSEDC